MYTKLISFIILLATPIITFSQQIDPLIGTWKIIDQRTGHYVSEIIIRKENHSQQYNAVINRVFSSPRAPLTSICHRCDGTLKNQPIFGMQTLTGLVQSKKTNHFHKGVWLNHQDGQLYDIDATLNTTKNRLKVNTRSQIGYTTNTLIWNKK